MPEEVRWIRSYVLEEGAGTVGTVCIYQAESPDAIRRHASLAGLPVTEIIPVHVTLRLDRVGDGARLYQLAALGERPLPAGPFVTAEVDGRIVAALPLAGGAPLADPFVPTVQLLPLLELRRSDPPGRRAAASEAPAAARCA